MARGKAKMKIETERLIIRPIQKGDEIVLVEMAGDGSFSELGFDENCSQWIDEWIDEAVSLSEGDNQAVKTVAPGLIVMAGAAWFLRKKGKEEKNQD